MINVRDKIEEIVLSIKSTGNISYWIDNSGSYRVITDDYGNLQVGFKIVLIYADSSLNRDVVLTDVGLFVDPRDGQKYPSFAFDGTGITEPDSWEMALYFEVGHRVELHRKYTNKAKSTNKLVQEYPLIWMYTDFEKTPSDIESVEFETVLRGAIVDFSEKELYEEQRIEQKFEPVLFPILELLDTAFNTVPYKTNFITPYGVGKDIDFLTTDRPFFGSEDQEANVLPQVTDAIEWETSLNWAEEGETCTGY